MIMKELMDENLPLSGFAQKHPIYANARVVDALAGFVRRFRHLPAGRLVPNSDSRR